MKSSVLCYARPWDHKQLRYLINEISPGANITLCSEHASVDNSGLRERYYNALQENSTTCLNTIPEISKTQALDIILRCRLLRNLERATAERHLIAMAIAIKGVLKDHSPSLVLSVTVDSYVIDLIRIMAEVKKIDYIGLVGTFVNGYFRITSRGEATINKQPEPDFSESAGSMLLNTSYSPEFNKKSISNPTKSVYRRWIANTVRIPFFFLKRHLTKDKYNYHYWASQLVAQANFTLLPPREPGQQNWEQLLDKCEKKTLFIPLQMFPECTVDYWCKDIESINYYETLEKLIEKLSKDFAIFIKEHPSVMGVRPSGFYTKIRNDPRIVVIPTYTSSNYILEKIDGVVVWTGSVGFEGMLRGRAVLGLETPYYASGKRFLKIDLDTPNIQILEHVAKCMQSNTTKEEQNLALNHLGIQLYRGSFRNDKTWNEASTQRTNDTKEMAASIRQTLTHSEHV